MLIQFSQVGIMLSIKVPVINGSRNSNGLKDICFFHVRKLDFVSQVIFLMFTCVHYSFPIFDWLFRTCKLFMNS